MTREHAATFRAAPGVGALRPGPQTALPGLVLAGAWTDTGWPATLEGAVLSGHAAAHAALRSARREAAAPAAARGGCRERRRGRSARMSELLIAAPLRLEALLISLGRARRRCVRKTGMGPARARAAAGALARGSRAARCSCSASAAGWTRRSVPGEVIVAEEVYAAADEGHDRAARALRRGARARRRAHRRAA